MPTQLGELIRKTRRGQSLSVRELARRIGKSAPYLVSLEQSQRLPGASEETLARIAAELRIDPDTILALAKRTPEELAPRFAIHIALYRLIRQLPSGRQEELRRQLEQEVQLRKPVARAKRRR